MLRRETDVVSAHTPENLRSHGWHGNLILARKGMVQAVSQVRFPGLEPRAALIVDLEIGGVMLRIASHFGLLRRRASKQANALPEATRSVLTPTILLGELNEWRVRKQILVPGATAAFWSNPNRAAQFRFAIPFACARSDPSQTAQSDFQPRSAPYIAISARLRSSADQGTVKPPGDSTAAYATDYL